jgi:PAS domain S-box-containing protein
MRAEANSVEQNSEPLDLRNLIETIPALVLCALTDGSVEFVNRAWLEYTGSSLQQQSGWDWQSAIYPDDIARFRDEWNAALASDKPFATEARIRRADGQYRWFLIRKAQVVAQTQNSQSSLRTLIACEDIDERKREESARRYIEERHRLVVETASDAVISMDGSGAILFANPATMRIFGYDPTELIGKPLTILMPEFMRELHENGFRRYLASGQRHINWQGTELTALRKNGQEFPVEVSFGELTRDGHKVFTGFIRDISERKQAEDKLRASERTLRELTETIPQMLWSAEADGAIDYCNQRVLDYTGLPAKQIHGAGWMKAVHIDDNEKMAQAWTYAVSTGEPFQYEFRCLRAADHAYRWCISSALPLRDQEGRVIKWFGSVVDLHDWKEAQQALQMAQVELARVSRVTTMGELTASIAHEVNQPLTAVTNNGNACLRLLANRNLEPEVLRQALEAIVADGTRASAVIARIRAFIKKTPGEKNKLDINEVIQEVLALVGRELLKHRVLLECQLTKALPPVLADRVQLQQVLLNLIMNGIEAMTAVKDQPRSLWVESRIDESGDILVAVRDSGTGLGSEADRVFTSFFTTKANGMGMGLPISRSLIEGHGGRLWAAPNVPRGAVFSFTLPVAAGSQP